MKGSLTRRLGLGERPAALAIVVYLMMAITLGALVWYQEHLRQQASRAATQQIAISQANALRQRIDRSLAVTYALAALIRQGGGGIADFDALATELIDAYPGVRGLQLSPDGIVRRIVPLENQLAMHGKDLLTDPVEGRDAAIARDTGEQVLTGPVVLTDGSTALIGHQPVYVPQRNGERFWGFVSVTIDLNAILQASHIDSLAKDNLAYKLTQPNPHGPDTQIIASSITHPLASPVETQIEFANTIWTLHIGPVGGATPSLHLTLFGSLALLFSAITGHLCFVLLELRSHRRELEARILKRTHEIEAAQDKLKATLDAIPDVLSEVDHDGRYRDFHAPADSIFFSSQKSVIGTKLEDHLGQNAGTIVRSALRKTEKTGRPCTCEIQIYISELAHWFEITISQKPGSGSDAPRFIMLTRDITDRKLQEERLQRLLTENETILRNAVVGILHIRHRTIIACNRRSEEILGYEPGELTKRSARCLYDSDDAFEKSGKAAYAVIGTARTYNEEILMCRKDGSAFWGAMTGSAIDPTHPHEGSIWILADITERKRAKEEMLRLNERLEERVALRTEELVKAKDEAERANLSKSEFLSSMSHELRTPLNAILGFSQLLKADPATPLVPDQIECVDEILRAGNHLLALINEVLDLARIESGFLELEPETVHVRGLLSECIALMRPEATARNVHIRSRSDEGETMHVDRLRIRQVLLNLMSNAIKYNRVGGEVELTSISTATSLRISVRDNGIGIPTEFLPLLFRPFERHGSSSRHVEGTGIGLALCKRLVEAMDGRISVESKLKSGSVFHIDLPKRQVAADTSPERTVTSNLPRLHQRSDISE